MDVGIVLGVGRAVRRRGGVDGGGERRSGKGWRWLEDRCKGKGEVDVDGRGREWRTERRGVDRGGLGKQRDWYNVHLSVWPRTGGVRRWVSV